MPSGRHSVWRAKGSTVTGAPSTSQRKGGTPAPRRMQRAAGAAAEAEVDAGAVGREGDLGAATGVGGAAGAGRRAGRGQLGVVTVSAPAGGGGRGWARARAGRRRRRARGRRLRGRGRRGPRRRPGAEPDADDVGAVEADRPGVAVAVAGAGLVGDAAGDAVRRRRRAAQDVADVPGRDGGERPGGDREATARAKLDAAIALYRASGVPMLPSEGLHRFV